MDEYVPLHVHSDASSDGLGTVEKLVARAAEMGIRSLSMTDHGTLANVIGFTQACKKYGVRPIVGLEAYLAYEGSRHHLTILSTSPTGFENLVGLSTTGHFNTMAGYPMVTMDNIYSHRTDLFILTGCPASAIHKGELDQGRKFVADLVSTVGRHQVAGEVMFVGSHNVWDRPFEIAKEMGLPWVITNDTHFPAQKQFAAHQLMVQARKGFTYDSRELWLKSRAEIIERASTIAHWSPDLIATGLDATINLTRDWTPPELESEPALPSVPDAREFLLEKVKKNFILNTVHRTPAEVRERRERLTYEWNVLSSKGFIDYLFILHDIIDWARRNHIRVGPGRGSGCGSYVLHLLGITGLDPIDYGLVFERFFNPAREDYPDVDVDFESDRRGEVIEYANQRWGAVPIATYSTYGHRSIVHDIARVLKVPKEIEVPAAERGLESEEYRRFAERAGPITEIYNSLEGQIRHRGKHPGGVIITDKSVPLERAGETMVAAWTEGSEKQLSKVGIVKFDLLGLTALSQIKTIEEWTGVLSEAIPIDDPKAMEVFQTGDTLGVFQWSGSEGIRDLTMRVEPHTFTDLVALNALYRPGALDAGTADKYPDYKKSPRLIHPRIDEHLAETYGVICFQEQVMAVFAEVTGGSFADADLARRLIVKSRPDDREWVTAVAETERDFVRKGTERGFPTRTLNSVWEELMTHSRYSFNRSHSAAYSLIAWRMAYYKAHYPAAFYASMLQHDRTNAQGYIFEAINRGIEIIPPHVSVSGLHPVVEGEKIFLPLTEIVGWGQTSAAAFLAERDNKPFTSYEDFQGRISKKSCNKRVRGFLERLGAFRGLSGDPSAAIPDYAELPVTGRFQTQQETMGYVLPDQKLVELVYKAEWAGQIAGFVIDSKVKESKRGAYRVFYLSPRGSFWSRKNMDKIQVGDFLVVKKTSWGEDQEIKRRRLE